MNVKLRIQHDDERFIAKRDLVVSGSRWDKWLFLFLGLRMKRNAKGFTLVEILIVVIILGILAAIVIPQFTSASSDARTSSVQSTLQSLRSQIELFKTQHNDVPPQDATSLWAALQNKTTIGDAAGATPAATNPYGPYVQNPPTNPLNNLSGVGIAPGATIGWIYVIGNNGYSISATDTAATGSLAY
jgi:general secretion pathway protein G